MLDDSKRWRPIRHVDYRENRRRRTHRTWLVGRTHTANANYVRDSRGRLIHYTQDGAKAKAAYLNDLLVRLGGAK